MLQESNYSNPAFRQDLSVTVPNYTRFEEVLRRKRHLRWPKAQMMSTQMISKIKKPPHRVEGLSLVKKKNLVPYDHHLAQVVTANLLGPGIGIVTTVTQARPLDVVLKKKTMIEIVPAVKMNIERTVHSISKAMLLHQEDHLLQIKVERIPQSYRIMIRILDMIILKEQMLDFQMKEPNGKVSRIECFLYSTNQAT